MASIHWGLKQALQPGPATEELSVESSGLPTDLRAALRLTETSEVLKEYLGEDFIPVYCAQKRSEIDAFEDAISAREYDWYL